MTDGDLVDPADVSHAFDGVHRVFFNMSVSADYLEAAAVVCSIAVEQGDLDLLVNMSQMTVSQMTSTSSEESGQQRLNWLVEQIEKWAALPVVNIRPTVFLDNPMFSVVPRQSIAAGVLALPIGMGHTSPVAASDVASVVSTVLRDPEGHVGRTYELTGPESLLHRAGRYDRLSDDVQMVTGRPAASVEHYIGTHRELFRG